MISKSSDILKTEELCLFIIVSKKVALFGSEVNALNWISGA